jgi:hypothetical protein
VNLHPPTINPEVACELLLHEMGETPRSGLTVPASLEQINSFRIARQLPMVSSMSCFNPRMSAFNSLPLNLDITPMRALWQRGLTLVLKQNFFAGKSQMAAACHSLILQADETLLSEIASVMQALLPLTEPTEADSLIELAGRFDTLLRDADHLQAVPAEDLLRDCLFYLSLKTPEDFLPAWHWTPEGEIQLRARLAWHAKQLSKLLYPTEDTDKIDKVKIEKYLLPVTDGLLFLNKIQLHLRFNLRLEKIDDRMLKIAVPVQLLMAEAISLSTGS